jgi:predicted MPP superfamily phosphohydrolase
MTAQYRILHLSDLHWDEETADDQKLVIKKFEADLKTIVEDKNIDLVVFSGDLVAKGQLATGFLRAKRELFEPMQILFGLSDSEILICPGNHDVDRGVAQSQTYLEAGLKAELQDSQSLNKHVNHDLLPLNAPVFG